MKPLILFLSILALIVPAKITAQTRPESGYERIGQRRIDDIGLDRTRRGPTQENTKLYEEATRRNMELFRKSQEGRFYQRPDCRFQEPRFYYSPRFYSSIEPPVYIYFGPHIEYTIRPEVIIERSTTQEAYYLDTPYTIIRTSKILQESFSSLSIKKLSGVLATQIDIYRGHSRYEYTISSKEYLRVTEEAFSKYDSSTLTILQTYKTEDLYILVAEHKYSKTITKLEFVLDYSGKIVRINILN